MPSHINFKEDITVIFKSCTHKTTQAATQAATQADDRPISARIMEVIREDPTLSQSQIAGMLGEERDTVKYYMRKMRLSGEIIREGSSQKGKWIIAQKNEKSKDGKSLQNTLQ